MSLAAVASACPSILANACFVVASSSRSLVSSVVMAGMGAGVSSGMTETGIPTRAFLSFPCLFGQRFDAALRRTLSGFMRNILAASS